MFFLQKCIFWNGAISRRNGAISQRKGAISFWVDRHRFDKSLCAIASLLAQLKLLTSWCMCCLPSTWCAHTSREKGQWPSELWSIFMWLNATGAMLGICLTWMSCHSRVCSYMCCINNSGVQVHTQSSFPSQSWKAISACEALFGLLKR